MSFSERLKQTRINRGLKQFQIAEMMGIAESTYCGYETGKRQPDVQKIKQLANILNVSGDYLLETGFDMSSTSSADTEPIKKAPTKSANALEDKLLNNFKNLDARGQNLLYELSNAMVESRRYVTRTVQAVDFAARGGQYATVNPVDDLDSLLSPEDLSDI